MIYMIFTIGLQVCRAVQGSIIDNKYIKIAMKFFLILTKCVDRAEDKKKYKKNSTVPTRLDRLDKN